MFQSLLVLLSLDFLGETHFCQFDYESRVLAIFLIFLHWNVLISRNTYVNNLAYYYYYYFTLCEFFTPVLTGGFSMMSVWQQVSSSLVIILTDFNSTVVWIVSILSLTSSSSGQFQRIQLQMLSPLLPCPTTFYALWQDPSICLSFLFYFHSMVRWNDKIHLLTSNFILWSVGMAKSISWLVLSFYGLLEWQNPLVD